jgi:putative methyltransferase (TIGR04325 family)
VLLSGVLQYLPAPSEVMKKIQESAVRYIIIDRTPFSDLDSDHITIQHVPKSIYVASYPCWIFSRLNLTQRFGPSYQLLAEFDSSDGRARTEHIDFSFGGMILRNICSPG